MRYAVTAQQMRDLEQQAFAEGVPSLLMMERAAACVVDAVEDILGSLIGRRVLFVCGPGNNGGDGLAAARMVYARGGHPIVWLSAAPHTQDARSNLSFLQALQVPVQVIEAGEELPDIYFDAVVDALFGTGLSRAPEGVSASLIAYINARRAPVISIDVPSGADASTGRVYVPCVSARTTVVCHCHKLGLLTGSARAYTGDLRVVDIGLPQALVERFAARDNWPCVAESKDLPALLPKRSAVAHKGSNGRVLILAGSFGMAGAAALAARTCLTAGAGLVTLAAPACIIPALQQLVPNATCIPVEQAVTAPPAHDVLLAGCGLSVSAQAWEQFVALYDRNRPTVLDADGLNMLAQQDNFRLSSNTVITPHPGEAARLLHTDIDAVTADLPGAARALHAQYNATVLLKSHGSVIYDGKRMAIHAITAPSLAKGGSGDMLAGILAALMAQEKPAPDVFRRGQAASLWMSMAANKAAQTLGDLSVLSGDVISCVGPVAAAYQHPPNGKQRHAPAGS